MALERADYLMWAKSRRAAGFDLAASNLLHCSIDELPGAREELSFEGTNEDGYVPLVEAIARRFGVTPDRVATAQGASGANFLVFLALLEPGDEVVVERPGYDPFLAAPAALGATVRRVDRRHEDGYRLDAASIAAALTPRTRLIVLSNLHNPTGAGLTRDALVEIGGLADRIGARVLVDEVYLDTLAGELEPPAATLSEVFISTSSLTKAYGLNAIRCGWVLASPEIAERVRRARDLVDGIGPVPTERLAALAFEHVDRLVARARAIIEPNRRLVQTFIESREDLAWVAPAGGTLAFPRLTTAADAGAFVERLLSRYDTAVVPGRFFDAPAHFRISCSGRYEALAGGLDAIGRALDES